MSSKWVVSKGSLGFKRFQKQEETIHFVCSCIPVRTSTLRLGFTHYRYVGEVAATIRGPGALKSLLIPATHTCFRCRRQGRNPRTWMTVVSWFTDCDKCTVTAAAENNKWQVTLSCYSFSPNGISRLKTSKTACLVKFISSTSIISLILRRSRTGTAWFYTSTSNKRAARPKLYTKSLTRDLKRMYSRLTLVRISINL